MRQNLSALSVLSASKIKQEMELHVLIYKVLVWRQHGQVVRAPDLKSVGNQEGTCSGLPLTTKLELFGRPEFNSLAMLANRYSNCSASHQLGCLDMFI